jgi:hypothetical protein
VGQSRMVCPPAQPPPPHPGRKPWFLTGYLEDGLASPATQRGFFLSEAGKPELGDVHEHYVWRFLRAQKIDLAGSNPGSNPTSQAY